MVSWPRPAARWPRPDFIARPPRAPLLAWMLLMVGALAAAVALDDWLALAQRREDTTRELDRLQALRLPVASRHQARTAAPASPAAVASAHEVTRQLQHPWREVLQAIERQAAPGVQWLRMEHDTARGDLRLTGVADRRDDVTATLESLARVPLLRDLMLIRIEAPEPPASASAPPAAQPATVGAGLRFEISLRVAGAGAGANAAGAP
jgi:Tfp pilus assembly protein PilN